MQGHRDQTVYRKGNKELFLSSKTQKKPGPLKLKNCYNNFGRIINYAVKCGGRGSKGKIVFKKKKKFQKSCHFKSRLIRFLLRKRAPSQTASQIHSVPSQARLRSNTSPKLNKKYSDTNMKIRVVVIRNINLLLPIAFLLVVRIKK